VAGVKKMTLCDVSLGTCHPVGCAHINDLAEIIYCLGIS